MSRTSPAAALALLLLLAPPLAAQDPVPPEAERNARIYELRPERHGISWFARHQHPQVQYEAGDVLTFDRYHTVDVMYTWLRRWAEQHPELVELYEVGRSYEGRPILQMTL
ncbi:MAG TPA: M14 family zinc carboxypeptidase, partial [Longimicrobiales bacterium]|nr:M14 family zinc carboxypeptidase [Longimicrobiales bacterium]